jgi:hypothetical protein
LRNRRFAKSACAAPACGIRSDNIQNRNTTVARKTKTPIENKPADDAAAPSANGKMSATEPKKKSSATAAPSKKKKTAAAKKPAIKKPSASSAKPALRPVEPTDEEIRLRAYFLAERRHRLSLPGDSAHDWIEARRQLIEESQP